MLNRYVDVTSADASTTMNQEKCTNPHNWQELSKLQTAQIVYVFVKPWIYAVFSKFHVCLDLMIKSSETAVTISFLLCTRKAKAFLNL